MGQDETGFAARLKLRDAEATQALGRYLAGCVKAGDCLLLTGPIGAGKSLLARSLIQALQTAHQGFAEDVPSPTYTLVQVYQAGDTEIWHADLYRLGDTSEIDELGLTEAMDHALCLIEWPDRLGDKVPEGALTITLAATLGGASREAIVTGPARWRDHLGDLEGALAA